MKRVIIGKKIIKWITQAEADGKEENGLGGLGGWFKKGQRWQDYLKNFVPTAHLALEELRRSILENNIRWTGEAMQENDYNTVPLWDNGKVDIYSWRAWGDLMAAIWSSEDNKDYNYMNFYMQSISVKDKLKDLKK